MASNTVLAKMTVQLSAITAQFNASLKQSQSAFLGFASSIKSIGNAIGLSLGGVAAFQGVKASIGIMADFEQTMSEVKAITGATGKEFEALEKDAIRLGSSTKFTATQVGQLQVAYGRLGFTTKEILNATEATLDLAAATGEDLAKSADVAGSTVRGFQLNAKETQRVVDVMAASFNKTALGLDNFTESMKYVAPVANAAGATVEETTAFLGTLADAGLRGSMAGTALRKIFTDMTKDGRPLRERLAELAKKGITLQDSFDEVGRTAQTALLVLSKNTEKTDELTKSFQNVSGEAARMARIMQDNLTGDVTKLTSAWEGLIIKMSDTGFLRKLTKDLTGFLNLLSGSSDINDELDTLAKAISETSVQGVFDDLIKMISKTRQELGKPIDLKQVEELAEKYKLTDEQANKLYQSVLEINKALSFQEKTLKQFNEFVERNGYEDLTKAAEDYKNRLYELILAEQIQREGFRKTASVSADHAKAFAPAIKAADDQIAAYRRAINIINEYAKSFEKSVDNTNQVTEEQVVSLHSLKEKLKELNQQYEKTALTDTVRRQGLATEIRLLGELVQKEEAHRKFLAEEFTTKAIKPSKASNNFLVAVGLDSKSIDEGLKKSLNAIKFFVQETNTSLKEIVDFTPLVHSALSGLGQALGNAISGSENLGEGLLRVLGGVLTQLGGMLITAGLGVEAFKKSLQSLNGFIAIAAGVALVAIGTAVSGSIKSLGANPTGGGSGRASSGRNNNFGDLNNRGLEIQLGGEWRIKGEDLVYVFNRQNQLNGRTRG